MCYCLPVDQETASKSYLPHKTGIVSLMSEGPMGLLLSGEKPMTSLRKEQKAFKKLEHCNRIFSILILKTCRKYGQPWNRNSKI